MWKRPYGQINMSNKNGTSSTKTTSADLQALEARVKAAQERHKREDIADDELEN